MALKQTTIDDWIRASEAARRCKLPSDVVEAWNPNIAAVLTYWRQYCACSSAWQQDRAHPVQESKFVRWQQEYIAAKQRAADEKEAALAAIKSEAPAPGELVKLPLPPRHAALVEYKSWRSLKSIREGVEPNVVGSDNNEGKDDREGGSEVSDLTDEFAHISSLVSTD
ncbi:hypothetical protein BAUCODRAFT_413100 [Baudoinia panamericana UAMH 10762]|uniref:Uncharacterized protein n=1 Tax=Baudoinia panamericana (strain UAMH 10762) TaxID=717646 RepID=M2NGI8_BAUPA|nr:uncharacterized protein BAUCODRAFT_413100 [Baudoinia panamericana UAMH 10762]EMC98110.1 hypothetical protein BAUCODRAFT_413100 [Baudoinia panamericana UAMH 10762]